TAATTLASARAAPTGADSTTVNAHTHAHRTSPDNWKPFHLRTKHAVPRRTNTPDGRPKTLHHTLPRTTTTPHHTDRMKSWFGPSTAGRIDEMRLNSGDWASLCRRREGGRALQPRDAGRVGEQCSCHVPTRQVVGYEFALIGIPV